MLTNMRRKEASEKDVRQKKVSCFVFFSFRMQGRDRSRADSITELGNRGKRHFAITFVDLVWLS